MASARAATDVMIVFDATGSMSDALGEAESQISNVVDQINSRYADVHYAVADVRDYAGLYGEDGDVPWTLLQPMTSDRSAIAGAIGGLVAQGGGDSPEAYGRALYEADHDPAIGYRPGAKRLVVLVADDVPHDNDLNVGIDPSVQIQASPFDTGVDPGPDGVVGTSDDIDWQSELAALKADGLPLYFVLFKGDTSLLPYWQTWAGITGGSASDSSSGQLGGSLVTAISAGASGCGRSFERIGVVDVCADAITGQGTLTASGNVTLDGGLAVGGPLQLDTSTNSITSNGVVSIALLRASGSVRLGAARLTIDGTATTDPSSGKKNLAKVTLNSISFSGADNLPVGGLAINMPEGDGLAMYLDAANGGGLVGSGTLTLPKLGATQFSAAAALGFYAGTPHPAQFLGGILHIGKIVLAPGWAFNGLDLSYQSATDTWTASGGLTVPIGSLQSSGTLTGGRLDSISVGVGGQEIPLGDSGFFFTGFGGGISGLARGPLTLSASTGGFWGAPKSPVEPIYLNKVQLTLNLSGAITLEGKVSFITKDHSPLTGEMNLGIRLSPFHAGGSVDASGDLSPLATLNLKAGAGFTAHAFTAQGTGSLSMHLLDGDGNEVLSSAGVGASGTLCSHPVQVKKLGVTVTLVPKVCQTLGFAAKWSNLQTLLHGDLRVLGQIVGGDPQSLVTVPVGAATGQPAAIRVPRGRNFLFLDVQSASGPPDVTLLAPGGARYTTSPRTGPLLVSSYPALHLTTITVIRPRAGIWRIAHSKHGSGSALRVRAETIHPVQQLRGTGGRAGSRQHGLTASGRVTVRWHSAGLPAGVRVAIIRSRTRRTVAGATTLAHGLRTSGKLTVSARRLQSGANWLILVATLHGVPFAQIDFSGPAWRAPSRPSKRHK